MGETLILHELSPSGGDHRLETKVRVQSNAMKTLNHVDLRNKGFVNLEGDFHSEEASGQTHTSASLHLQYHATLMSVNLSRPGCIAKCLWYGKKKWIHSHHNIHERSHHSPPPYGLPPFLVHFPQSRPRFDSSYLDDGGDRLTLLCLFRTQSLIVSFKVPELQ